MVNKKTGPASEEAKPERREEMKNYPLSSTGRANSALLGKKKYFMRFQGVINMKFASSFPGRFEK